MSCSFCFGVKNPCIQCKFEFNSWTSAGGDSTHRAWRKANGLQMPTSRRRRSARPEKKKAA